MIDGTMHRGARFLTFMLAVCGVAAMAMLVFVVHSQPQLIEEKLQSFAIEQVETRAVSVLDQAQLAVQQSENSLLQSLANRFTDEAEFLAQRDASIQSMVASVARDRCDCATNRLATGASIASIAIRDRVAALRIGEQTVGDFISARYELTVKELRADLTTFGAANLVAFLTLMFLSIFKGRFGARILPMTLLLAAYVLYAMYWYVFTQDWAAAILFNNWAVVGYVASMLVVYLLLIDFTFFNGAITDAIIQAIATVLSNAPVPGC
jgi:hypothetical protein